MSIMSARERENQVRAALIGSDPTLYQNNAEFHAWINLMAPSLVDLVRVAEVRCVRSAKAAAIAIQLAEDTGMSTEDAAVCAGLADALRHGGSL